MIKDHRVRGPLPVGIGGDYLYNLILALTRGCDTPSQGQVKH